ncbi:MAG: tRNA (adenosine(37)-N6)-threonylcarbamoyltransferase complex dimerization subunit type 1 TsaB [Spirochaetia bacterium]
MNILAFDTATEVLSVALRIDPDVAPEKPAGRPHVYTEMRDAGLRHSRILMPLVGRLLADADMQLGHVDLVACTRGPGSFTGLRIGMATAKGLAVAIASVQGVSEPPIVSVSTMEVIAHALPSDGSIVVPVVDGRKNRFYAAIFRSGVRLTTDLDLPAMEIMNLIAEAAASGSAGSRVRRQRRRQKTRQLVRVIVTGPHADLFASRIRDPTAIVVDPAFRRGHAGSLIPLAVSAYRKHGPDAPGQGPVYVRGSDAELARPKD